MKKTFICLVLFSIFFQAFSQNSSAGNFYGNDSNPSKSHRGFQKRYTEYSESKEDPSLSKSGAVSSKSRVNWIEKEFISDINLDLKKAQLQMPAGKTAATALITQRLPFF